MIKAISNRWFQARLCVNTLFHKAEILEQISWIHFVHTIAWELRILPQFPLQRPLSRAQWFLICCLNSNFGLCTICAIVPANCTSRGPIFSAFTMFGAAAHGHSQRLQLLVIMWSFSVKWLVCMWAPSYLRSFLKVLHHIAICHIGYFPLTFRWYDHQW